MIVDSLLVSIRVFSYVVRRSQFFDSHRGLPKFGLDFHYTFVIGVLSAIIVCCRCFRSSTASIFRNSVVATTILLPLPQLSLPASRRINDSKKDLAKKTFSCELVLSPFHPFVLHHRVGVFFVLVCEFWVFERYVGDTAVGGLGVGDLVFEECWKKC